MGKPRPEEDPPLQHRAQGCEAQPQARDRGPDSPLDIGHATAAEVTQKEVELIIALRSNDPLVGYNRWPRFKG